LADSLIDTFMFFILASFPSFLPLLSIPVYTAIAAG
jgi:hypothetical protein